MLEPLSNEEIRRRIDEFDFLRASGCKWKNIPRLLWRQASYRRCIAKFLQSEIPAGLMYNVQDKRTLSPANAEAFGVFQEKLDEVFGTLTEREEKVLRLRFGLGDGYPRTLEEVGSVFNVTRERVRHIEAKALRKMRHPTRARELRPFLNWKCNSDP